MQKLIKDILSPNDTKLVMCVLDGLGGLPVDGKTELEAARTPNMDALAQTGDTGLHMPVAPGITPGSGAAHLGLFGYDPLTHAIGRGVLEALGLGMEVTNRDIAVRGNFATVKYIEDSPVLTDRRAGRIPTEENKRITQMIRDGIQDINGVKVTVKSGLEHRFVVMLSFPEPLAEGADDITDTDPQATGESPLRPVAKNPAAKRAASVLEEFISRATEIIRDEERANSIILRGASRYPDLASYKESYGVNSAAIAAYPMYRGVAKLVGMDVIEFDGTTISDEVGALEKHWDEYDFFYLHVKKTDSYGEDGNFEGKAAVIAEFDSLVPRITALNPDVLVITGDHSTPSLMKSHSWHPVPILVKSKLNRGGGSRGFSETECARGELGVFRAVEIMQLMLAHAQRLQKFGA